MTVARQDQEKHRHAGIRIDRRELPEVAMPMGMFGSRRDRARMEASDDSQAGLMSCLYPFVAEG